MKPDPRPKTPVAFSKPVARRVARAVKRVEAGFVRPPDQGVIRVRAWQPGVLRAVVTNPIPSGTPSSPSTSGTVTIQTWDCHNSTGGASTNTGDINVRCCNDHVLTGSIPVGKCVKVAWIEGDYWWIQGDC